MSSEDFDQRYAELKGKKVGKYELFETQLTTLNQYAQAGLIPNMDYGDKKARKPDAILINRVPEPHAVLVGSFKKNGGITDKNWQALANELLFDFVKPLNADMGYLSDGIKTYWINGRADKVILIDREDGLSLPEKMDFSNKSFVTELEYILSYFDPATNLVKSKERTNPQRLAEEVWQTIWRLRADKPEDCLATFVELFLFKFLDDLKLLKTNQYGSDISLPYVMQIDKDKSFAYYFNNVRPYIKHIFPEGKDGLSIINGIVLQPANKDHNIIFHEIIKKFIKFGSLKNTDPEFKTKLYESFLQESKTTSTFGQHFTPRKIVSAIHDMADIENLVQGQKICDPAAGVGGFILEQMARDLSSQWNLKSNALKAVHAWEAHEIVPKTAILAKANALVHCGDLLADQPKRVKSFANWLNKTFICHHDSALGSLDTLAKTRWDLILSNPPFVVSGSADIGKLIKSDALRNKYFSQKYSGVEGLFVQFIVNALNNGGNAWVLLPESFFLRTTDNSLRNWVIESCKVDFLAILPERTFFNTPKRVLIVHLQKRHKKLSATALVTQTTLKHEETLLFAISEIGETRDAKRLPCRNDLPDMIKAYKHFKVGADVEDSRSTVVASIDIYNKKSLNIRQCWPREAAIHLGLIGANENPDAAVDQINAKISFLEKTLSSWNKRKAHLRRPPMPIKWQKGRALK